MHNGGILEFDLGLSASVQILFVRKEHGKVPLKYCERKIKLYCLSLKLAREGSSACHGKQEAGRREGTTCIVMGLSEWSCASP